MSPAEAVPFSEFVQHPARTARRLEHAREIRLVRRDAQDLVLMPADHAERDAEVLDLTGRLLEAILRETDGERRVAGLLPHVLPWAQFLPAPARDRLASELAQRILGAASVANVAPLAQLLIEWRHTAEVYADPDLLRQARRQYSSADDFGPVAAPEPAETDQ